MPPYMFLSVDHEARDFSGYARRPTEQTGWVNGVSTLPGRVGTIIKVHSYYTPDIDPLPPEKNRFELTDERAEMIGPTTIKGYDLAVDFMRRLLFKDHPKDLNGRLNPETGWQLKTEFDGQWYGVDGPSASLAIVATMVSELAGEPIYRNRFVTGTVEPSTGNVGIIGGTYMKGIIPARLQELLGDQEEMYFMFPAGNLWDLSMMMSYDPMKLSERITGLPIVNVGQAYHLLTCGPTISDRQWQESLEQGQKTLETAVAKIVGKAKR